LIIKIDRKIFVFCLACAFEGLTADLQIQQQLKPTQSDIHIDMDKLVAYGEFNVVFFRKENYFFFV